MMAISLIMVFRWLDIQKQRELYVIHDQVTKGAISLNLESAREGDISIPAEEVMHDIIESDYHLGVSVDGTVITRQDRERAKLYGTLLPVTLEGTYQATYNYDNDGELDSISFTKE